MHGPETLLNAFGAATAYPMRHVGPDNVAGTSDLAMLIRQLQIVGYATVGRRLGVCVVRESFSLFSLQAATPLGLPSLQSLAANSQ